MTGDVSVNVLLAEMRDQCGAVHAGWSGSLLADLFRRLDEHITTKGELPDEWKAKPKLPASIADVKVDEALAIKCCIKLLASLPLDQHTVEGYTQQCGRCKSLMVCNGTEWSWRWITPSGGKKIGYRPLSELLDEVNGVISEPEDIVVESTS